MAHPRRSLARSGLVFVGERPEEPPRPLLALPAPPGHRGGTAFRPPYVFSREPGPLQAGIRHIASGTMSLSQTPLRQVLASLADRARYGGHDISGLEAVVVDWRHRVCAGFWAESMV